MYFSRKITLLLLFSLYSWAMVLRYPDINGPHDSDGSLMVWMAAEFEDSGENPWILSLFSYFGMYPFSYPNGTPIFLSSFNQLVGTDVDISILIICSFLTLIGINSMFMLSKEFGGNNLAFFATLSFSTAHYFVNYTFWSISARGLYLVLIPLFMFTVIKTLNNRPIYFSLSFVIYLLLLSTHRSATYLFVVVIVPVALYALIDYLNKKPFFRNLQVKREVRMFYLMLVLILALLSIYTIKIYNDAGIPIRQTWIEDRYSGNILAPLLNVSFSITSAHLLSIFAINGFLYLVLKRYNQRNQILLSLMVLVSSPFVIDYEYFTPTILPVICLLSALGIFTLIRFCGNIDKRSSGIILVVLLVSSNMFELYSQELNTNISAERHNPPELEGYGVYQETKNNANWIGEYIPQNSMVLDGYQHSHHSSYVKMTTMRQNDIIANNENYLNYVVVEPVGWFDMLFNQKASYFGGRVSTVSNSEVYKASLITEVYGDSNHPYVKTFEIEYVTDPSAGTYWFLDSPEMNISRQQTPPFFLELYESNYKLHSNELLNIYFFRGPY